MMKIAPYFTKLVLLISICGCTQKHPYNQMFQDILDKEDIDNSGERDYIFWNSISCSGCRQYSLKVLLENDIETIIVIVPSKYKSEVREISPDLYFIDTNDNFNQKHFGINNIGLIRMSSGKVNSIRNYNPNEMDQMKEDILSIESKKRRR